MGSRAGRLNAEGRQAGDFHDLTNIAQKLPRINSQPPSTESE